VRFYRISRLKFRTPARAFNGIGASKAAHRWNHANPDIRAVYASDSLALAAMENLVHFPEGVSFPRSVYFTINIPDGFLEVAKVEDLPRGWNRAAPGDASRDYGTEFIEGKRAVGLVVPTAIQPEGLNVVINPLHGEFSLKWVDGPFAYRFDRRL
jgi:RES domain-containing protein